MIGSWSCHWRFGHQEDCFRSLAVISHQITRFGCPWPCPSRCRLFAGASCHPSLHINALTKKLCKDTPVLKSAKNKCSFKCPNCGEIFHSWHLVTKHCAQVHSVKSISWTQVSNYITKVVSHKCWICQDIMFCDLTFIERHLRLHKLKTYQYIEKYCLGLQKNFLEVSYTENLIGNMCIYECCECRLKFDSQASFYRHKATTFHSQQSSSSESLTKKVCHKCKLCNNSLLCDRVALKSHFKNIHGMSTEEYCKKMNISLAPQKLNIVSRSFLRSLEQSEGLEKSCVYACDLCSKKYYTSESLKGHFKVSHKTTKFKSLEIYLVKGFSYQCKECFKLILCDKDLVNNHMRRAHGIMNNEKGDVTFVKQTEYNNVRDSFIKSTPISLTVWYKTVLPKVQVPIQEVTSKIGNLCTFICPDCDSEVFSSWSFLIAHCKKVHKYRIFYKHSLVSVARCHSCLICSKAVLCDRLFIANHLHYHHKIPLKKYEKIYQKNGGDVLPTFLEWMTSNTKTQWWNAVM